ncbi:hypothetical protein GW796_06215 [archaeon]|nr:hypothetical protein [archaeon]
MKYSNLTSTDKILGWFAKHPLKINDYCDDNTHIFDWIYNGYRGQSSAKLNLVYELIKRNANFSNIKEDTFRQIVFSFISSLEQPQSSSFVLTNLLKEQDKLNILKSDFSNLNFIISSYPNYSHNFSDIKDKIIYSNVPPFIEQDKKDIAHVIGYNSHPIIFLIQYQIFKGYLENKNIQKLNTIHELNEHIVLSHIPFQYKESNSSILSELNNLNYTKSDSCLTMLEKLNSFYIENFTMTTQIKENSEIIKNIKKRELYRTLSLDLSNSNTQFKKNKI